MVDLSIAMLNYQRVVLRKVYVHGEIDSRSFQAIGPAKTCELEMETAAAVARVGLQVGQGQGAAGAARLIHRTWPSGELTVCYGKIHHLSWENPLFRLGHFP